MSTFAEYVSTAKALIIEGMTLTQKTAEIFEDFMQKTLDRLEKLQLDITSDQDEDPDA